MKIKVSEELYRDNAYMYEPTNPQEASLTQLMQRFVLSERQRIMAQKRPYFAQAKMWERPPIYS